MTLHTWINHELVSIDVDEHWLSVFAAYDALVPTETAVAIATAVCNTLKSSVDDSHAEMVKDCSAWAAAKVAR